MASLNKVFLIGNLTKDPELRYTQNGTAVCDVRLAMSRRFVGQNGETRDEACFIDVTIFGKRGEAFSRFFQKGKPALIEGRLKFDQWEDKQSGQKRSKISVVAEDWQFVGAAPQREGDAGGREKGAPAAQGTGEEEVREEGAPADETPF